MLYYLLGSLGKPIGIETNSYYYTYCISRLTFRTLFHTSEAILEEPPAERGEGTIYRLCHALQPIAAMLLSS